MISDSESHEDNAVANILKSPINDDIKEVDIEEHLDFMEKETFPISEIQRNEHETLEKNNADKKGN